jgi:hypothetical protein
MESGLRPYERRALSISAVSQHPRMSTVPDVVDAQLRLQPESRFLRRDVMLPSVMASDPAHDPNALPVEALKKPHVLSIYDPAFRARATRKQSS